MLLTLCSIETAWKSTWGTTTKLTPWWLTCHVWFTTNVRKFHDSFYFVSKLEQYWLTLFAAVSSQTGKRTNCHHHMLLRTAAVWWRVRTPAARRCRCLRSTCCTICLLLRAWWSNGMLLIGCCCRKAGFFWCHTKSSAAAVASCWTPLSTQTRAQAVFARWCWCSPSLLL